MEGIAGFLFFTCFLDGNFADFVTLVSQQEHGQSSHVAAVAAASSLSGGTGQGVLGHPGPVRSPYSTSGYPPAPIPPTSLSHVSRPLAVHRSNGKISVYYLKVFLIRLNQL